MGSVSKNAIPLVIKSKSVDGGDVEMTADAASSGPINSASTTASSTVTSKPIRGAAAVMANDKRPVLRTSSEERALEESPGVLGSGSSIETGSTASPATATAPVPTPGGGGKKKKNKKR